MRTRRHRCWSCHASQSRRKDGKQKRKYSTYLDSLLVITLLTDTCPLYLPVYTVIVGLSWWVKWVTNEEPDVIYMFHANIRRVQLSVWKKHLTQLRATNDCLTSIGGPPFYSLSSPIPLQLFYLSFLLFSSLPLSSLCLLGDGMEGRAWRPLTSLSRGGDRGWPLSNARV